MEENKDKCYFIGHRSEALIRLAEEKLGLKFPDTYRYFIEKYGAGNYGSAEIFGIVDDDFENSSVPDAIWYTLTERDEINLPLNLLIIYNTGDEALYCLDFNRRNEAGEPAVISFIPGIDFEEQEHKIIANDFGDFLLELVTHESDV